MEIFADDEYIDTTIVSCEWKLMTLISCNRNTPPSFRLFRYVTYITKLSFNRNTSPASRLFSTVTYTTQLSCNRNISPLSRLFRTVTYTTKQSRKRLFIVWSYLVFACMT